MKYKFLFVLPVAFLIISFINKNNKENFTPPGTVLIHANFFMDETEITNISWAEYMFWNKNNFGETSSEYLASIPDTAVWENPFKTYYLNHPAYKEYPVVGVTWKQAKEYCDWRSDRVMEQLQLQKKKNPKKIIPLSITYRLPSISEWELVAKAGYLERTQNKIDKKYSHNPKANFKSSYSDMCEDVTAPVYEYWPNSYGVYNILGNVAEMSNEEGIAKGGSWTHSKNDITVQKNIAYTKTENWIGFRCVCEIIY